MRPKDRRQEIVALVNRLRLATVEDLAEKLDVSRETIRRDLSVLQSDGSLRKYHGGARALESNAVDEETESPFAHRMAHNIDAKHAIAQTASHLFQRGDSIFIDTGSTTLAVAEALAPLSSLLVITNSPRIAASIAANNTNKAFLIGGAYGAEVGESLGPLALEQIAKFRANHVILTVGAMDTHCIMNFDLQEAEIARAMIERADSVTVVADHSKFDRRAVFEVAPLSRIARVITDRAPSRTMTEALRSAGVELHVAGETSL